MARLFCVYQTEFESIFNFVWGAQNMKIIHRLILLIVVGLLGSITIAGVGYTRLGGLNTDMRNIMDNTLPSLNTLNTANSEFLLLRVLIRAHIMSTSDTDMQKLDLRISDSRSALERELTKYQGLFSDDKDRALFMKSKEGIGQYLVLADKALALSRANKNEEADAAVDQLANLADSISTDLNANISYNEELAGAADKIGQANFESAKWFLISVSVVTALILIVIGLMIYKQVHNGLSSAQNTIGKIKDTLDFTLRADAQGSDEISEVLRSFNGLIQHLQNSLRDILAGVEKVSTTANQLQNSAERVSEGSSSQNASTSHMAASVEEMTVSINHVADQARTTSDQSNEVGRKAEAGQDVIAKTVNNIHDIAEAVESAAGDIRQLDEKGREIESVINIISSVAEQTNLLALNAAIEAARAGEQGRGFAVVADEVRSLAARTATSTKEISDIITAIQSVSSSAVKRMGEAITKVEQGVQGAGSANDTMSEICRVAAESVSLVEDISHAIREQGAATNSIAQQVENVAQMVEENSQAANETSRQANELTRVSDSMKQIVNAYRL